MKNVDMTEKEKVDLALKEWREKNPRRLTEANPNRSYIDILNDIGEWIRIEKTKADKINESR